MLANLLLVLAPLLMPSFFTRSLPYEGSPSISERLEGIQIKGEWIEGKAPGVRLETDILSGAKAFKYKGFYITLTGDGKTYLLRFILPDKAGFLDQIPIVHTTSGKAEKVWVPLEKRRPLVTGIPLAEDGAPLVLLVEPAEKGKFSLTIGKIEWVEREAQK